MVIVGWIIYQPIFFFTVVWTAMLNSEGYFLSNKKTMGNDAKIS